MSRLIPGALQHVSGAPGGPASGPATPTANKPDDSRENSALTRQSQPMGALVGGVVCTLDRLAGCVHRTIEVECGHKAVRAIREHAAVRIELRIDDGDILGMVTLGDEEERVVFADVTHVVDRLASHRRTGESVVHIDYLDQEKRYYKE